jgi:hypothetical protein
MSLMDLTSFVLHDLTINSYFNFIYDWNQFTADSTFPLT